MIVDTSLVVDAVTDSGERGGAARHELSSPGVTFRAPGLLAIEVLSALRRLAADSRADFTIDDVPAALTEAEAYGIHIEGTPWSDVGRAWELSHGSIRYTDGVFVAAAERHRAPLLTTDVRLSRSRAKIRCEIVNVLPA